MRFGTAHLLLMVLAAAIGTAIYRSSWGRSYVDADIVFGAYMVLLTAATVGSWYSRPAWRRPWLGYAVFGWSWLALVLRGYLGEVLDSTAPLFIEYSLIGMGLGLLSAIVCHCLPGMG